MTLTTADKNGQSPLTNSRPAAGGPIPQGTDAESGPPSVHAVLGVLQGRTPMTGADIRQVCGLPRRTVYGALRTLRERGLVMQRQSLRDTRQSYFWLVAAPGSVGRGASDRVAPAGSPSPGQ